jgi:EAL domain-containing protein (putative c-di-GMP-specific phosphodiesterase class I)
MAVPDISGAAPLQRALRDRERFLVFALTAADLLVEITERGRITFAAGAFERRLGKPPGAWVGLPVADLVAPSCRSGLARALAMLQARDRLPPVSFLLNNAAATPIGVAGLRLGNLPGAPPGGNRLCLTFSALPQEEAAAGALPETTGLGQALENELLAGTADGASLGMFELAGPSGPLIPRPELAGRIAETLASAVSDGGLAGELSSGRYGVMSRAAGDFTRIAAAIENVAQQAGLDAEVSTTALPLETDGLSPMQATRALRYALGTFARGGAEGLAREGFSGGLAGFVAQAYARAEDLQRLIMERRFRLAFQPIVALGNRRVHHFEALLRPNRAAGEEGPEGAGDFVIFAETVGLTETLDWAVVETCAEAARKANGARIACNLSGLSLQSPGFRDRLVGMLRAEPALVPRLLIEITETAEIEDEAAAVETVEALRALGLPLCIDDFGAGAAAFRYLKAFRVDYVKIDGQYVEAALRSQQDRGFVAAMVDLARTVGAQVVAERIETEAAATVMQALGVGYGQGWLFGKPGRLPGSL